MRKTILLLLTLASFGVIAQQVPNNSFESWEPQLNGTYDEPGGNWWATLNFLRGFGPTAPVTVKKTTDAHSGQYAAEISTGTFGSFVVPGILVSGKVGEIDIQNPTDVVERGQPYTALPVKFSGYFKHAPVNGDSAAAVALLTKYNTSTSQRDTIAMAQQIFYSTVNSYTQFEVEFEYHLQGTAPDTIEIALVSSAGGESLQGQPGSKLFIDDLALDYTAGIRTYLEDMVKVEVYPNPSKDILTIKVDSEARNRKVALYNQIGEVVLEAPFNAQNINLNIQHLPASPYLYVIMQNGKAVAAGNIIKN